MCARAVVRARLPDATSRGRRCQGARRIRPCASATGARQYTSVSYEPRSMNDQPDRRPDAEPVAFDEAHADVDPIRQFARWWNDAVAAVTLDVSAMALVTVGAE